jgi:hypothetical protein
MLSSMLLGISGDCWICAALPSVLERIGVMGQRDAAPPPTEPTSSPIKS